MTTGCSAADALRTSTMQPVDPEIFSPEVTASSSSASSSRHAPTSAAYSAPSTLPPPAAAAVLEAAAAAAAALVAAAAAAGAGAGAGAGTTGAGAAGGPCRPATLLRRRPPPGTGPTGGAISEPLVSPPLRDEAAAAAMRADPPAAPPGVEGICPGSRNEPAAARPRGAASEGTESGKAWGPEGAALVDEDEEEAVPSRGSDVSSAERDWCSCGCCCGGGYMPATEPRRPPAAGARDGAP